MPKDRLLPCLSLAALLLVGTIAPAAADDGFRACLDSLGDRARSEGIRGATVNEAIGAIRYQQRVVDLDRRQPEFLQTFGRYLENRVTEQRVRRGRELLEEHRELLERVHRDFGVPPAYLVAFWGLETNYGGVFGDIPVLDSVATLACDQRRSRFFGEQFIEALRLIDRGVMERHQMRGSWAGAMGHTQFLPSTVRAHGIDYDGDGRVDLWNSLPDAFASSANFLSSLGWQDGQRWGREVRLPEGFPLELAGMNSRRPLSEWSDRGVRSADGGPLPRANLDAALLLPAGHRGPAFLVYRNFHIIMRWNPSSSYALSVGILADRIAGGDSLVRLPPEEEPLSREDVRDLQRRLNDLGHDSGTPDGIAGSRTREAVRNYQLAAGLPADGHPNRDLLRRLRAH